MKSILSGIGYGMLAIAVLILVSVGGVFMATVGAVVSLAGLGIAVIVFVAFMIKDWRDYKRRRQ